MKSPLDAILLRSGIDRPDGRPLYQYRITPAEADELREFVARQLAGDHRPFGPTTAKTFCLWAADHFRQSFSGGHWNWRVILDAVDADHLRPGTSGYPALISLVREGLNLWGRRLLRSNTQTEYLVSLGCEGGLPLRLVSQQKSAFREFFRALLLQFRANAVGDRLIDGIDSEDLARLAGSQTLPRTLQQPVVYQLAGEIVGEVWRYYKTLNRHPANPVAALDELHPEWRASLPLRLDDTEAEEFLGGLVTDAARVAREAVPPIRWIPHLVRTTNEESNRWTISATLDIAGSVPTAQFPAQLGRPARALLRIRYIDGSIEPWARIVLHGENQDAHYRVTPLPGRRRLLSSALSVGAVSLEVHSDASSYAATTQFPGGLGLAVGLPWSFALDEVDQETIKADFAGEGRCRVGARAALVVLPSDWHPADDSADIDDVGPLDDLPGYRVVRIAATTRFQNTEGERCTVRLNAVTASLRQYRVDGMRMSLLSADLPVYAGLPKIFVADGAAVEQQIAPAALQWRSDTPDAQWTPLGASSVGAGTIRYLEDGEVVFVTRLMLCPRDLRVTIQPLSEVNGKILISGAGDAAVDVVPDPSVMVRRDRTDDSTVVLELAMNSATAPALSVAMALVWPKRGRLDLIAPFPAKIVGFERLTGVRVKQATVSELSGCRAFALSPVAGSKAVIIGELQNGPAEREVGTISHAFTSDVGTVGRFSLDAMQADVTDMLSATDRLDARIRLRFEAADGPTLTVTRYALEMTCDRGGTCRIKPADWASLSDSEKQRLRLVGIPLIDPARTPVPLVRHEPAPGSVMSPEWRLPDVDLPGGAWMVYGFDGLWSRLRPRLLVREPLPSVSPGSLREAVNILPDAERAEAICRVLSVLAVQPSHPDWDLVYDLVSRTVDVPVASFSVLREGARIPDVWPDYCGMLLLRSLFKDNDAPHLTVTAMEQLPFSWAALPVGAIERAAERVLRWLAEDLGDNTIAAQLFQHQLSAMPCPWMVRPIKNVIQIALDQAEKPQRQGTDEDGDVVVAVAAASKLRHSLPERLSLPAGVLFREVSARVTIPGFPASVTAHDLVAFAPLCGALAACHDICLTPTAQFQLRRVMSRFGNLANAAFLAGYAYALAERWQGKTIASGSFS